jgi:hypothetical protein
MSKSVTLPIKNIINRFDVRLELDQDRVLQFVGMYQAGVDVPDIEVVQLDEEDFAFIDGRHRAAALQYLGRTTVNATVVNGNLKDNPVQLYGRALRANWGGALPPTRAGITHTMVRMIEAGASFKDIKEELGFLPAGSLKAYHTDASSILSKRRIGRALDDVRDNALTVEAAALKNHIPLKVLQNAISGKKGKWGHARDNEQQYVTEFKSYVSKVLLSANTGISQKLIDALRKVDAGEISAKGAAGMIKAWKEHLRRTGLRIEDWEARLAAITGEQDKATGQAGNGVVVEPVLEAPDLALGPLGQKRLKRLDPSTPKRPRQRADEAFEYAGTRLPNGFWNEELPRAIKVTKAKTAAPLIEYFAKNGKVFTLKQVSSALERLRKRGL